MFKPTTTPRDLQKLEEAYTNAKQVCAAFWLPHTFKAGEETISMCWQGRIDRAQGLVIQQPDNEVLRKAYDQLCRTSDQFRDNARQASEKYKSLCADLNQPAKSLPTEGDCDCHFCMKIKTHVELWRAEIDYGAAAHELMCGYERHGIPAILEDETKGADLLKKLIESMKIYRAMCEKYNQPLDWAGVVYGWSKKSHNQTGNI